MLDEPAAAPALWELEVANVLRMAERRGRIPATTTERYLDSLGALPILVEASPADTGALVDLSRRRDLSIYDACYLELAIRLARPLATLDRRLAAAARAEGVHIVA